MAKYPHFIAQSEKFIAKYGAAGVFLARFTAVVRAFVPLVAGILQMPPRQFYAANILSAIAWAPAHVFPGVVLAMAVGMKDAPVRPAHHCRWSPGWSSRPWSVSPHTGG